jgi:hypothetical protein
MLPTKDDKSLDVADATTPDDHADGAERTAIDPRDASIDAIEAIMWDAAELDAQDPSNITDEDRVWADGMRARMKVRFAARRRSLMPPNEEPTLGGPIRPSILAMGRDALLATVHGIARRMGGQMQIANRKLTELSDDDLRRLVETLSPEEEGEP